MTRTGAMNLITDVPGLKVGQAADADVLTGVTVIRPARPSVCAVHVAGGGPGTRETDALKLGTLVDEVDAITLSGGSVYGLASADGVIAEIGARGEGFSLMDMPGVPKSPIVPLAILYDLANGGNKDWGNNPPYVELGRQAYHAIGKPLQLGAFGAGIGARAGSQPGGIGSASWVNEAGITVGAIAAVNCFGSVLIPGTDQFWAAPFEQGDEFGGCGTPSRYQFDAEDWGAAKMNPAPRQNTTIACIATDADLTPSECQRLSDMAVAGLARAIRPVFAPFDGDVVFALATGDVPIGENRPTMLSRLGELAASALARSVARGVYAATI